MTRILSLVVLLCVAHLVQGSTNDPTSYPDHGYCTRSVWSILESCAVTVLLHCVAHAVPHDIPTSGVETYKYFYFRRPWIFLTGILAPEVMVLSATKEWAEVRQQVRDFRLEGYEWSMTHGFFAEMGGFVFHGDSTSRVKGKITSLQFRQLCQMGKIMNPCITENDIKAIGNSDVLGQTICIFQLMWFTLQVIARAVDGLAITLVELYTVSIIALAIVYTFFWWDKPPRPQSPHIFYQSEVTKVFSKEELSKSWMAKPSGSRGLVSRLFCIRKASSNTEEEMTSLRDANPDGFQPREPNKLFATIDRMNRLDVHFYALNSAWIIIGGLHLVAWNWVFPTEIEQIMWRVASLVLFASPPVIILVQWLERFGFSSDIVTYIFCTAVMIGRALLVGLMFASLRALPSSAYEIVNWTTFIPHL